MSRYTRKHIDYRGDMKQNWTQNNYARTYQDQFGFTIRYGSHYQLEHHGVHLITLNSLQAAKDISTIYLNDLIIQ